MKAIALAAPFVFLLSAGSASAADLTDTRPTYDWTSGYVGANGGYSFGGDDSVGFNTAGGGKVGDLTLQGWSGGLQAGYNFQYSAFVLGAEADTEGGDISDSGSSSPDIPGGDFSFSDKIDYYGTLRARLGFAVDQFLFYGTGGFAWGNVDYKLNGTFPLGQTANLKDQGIYTGYALGAGAEYAFDPARTIRAEYLCVNLGAQKISAEILDSFGADTGYSASTTATPTSRPFASV